MDKTEYKILYDQMMSLVGEHAFAEAMDICRQIDWRKVKNVTTLCTVSEIYKINKQYEDARDILMLALERMPSRRKTLYSLCELCVKLNDIVDAVKYYNEYKKLAPNDPEGHILHYKICDAQNVSLEEKIELLQRYKEESGCVDDKWAYELAYLYHRCGLATKCIEVCNEIMMWFGEGKYLLQAMDLKKKYVPLTPDQQAAYDRLTAPVEEEVYFSDEDGEYAGEESGYEQEYGEYTETYEGEYTDEYNQTGANEEGYPSDYYPEDETQEGIIPTVDEDSIQVKQVNVDKYSTMNLQAELAQSVQNFFEGIDDTGKVGVQIEASDAVEETAVPETQIFDRGEEPQPYVEPEYDFVSEDAAQVDEDADMKIAEPVRTVRKEDTLNKMLSQGTDGQINLVVPDQESPEKQITGQMNISGYLNEWEEERKARQRKRIEQARRKSLEQTNDILSALDRRLPNVEAAVPTTEVPAQTVVLTPQPQVTELEVDQAGIPVSKKTQPVTSEPEVPTANFDTYYPQEEASDETYTEDVQVEGEALMEEVPLEELPSEDVPVEATPSEALPSEEDTYEELPEEDASKYDTSQIPVDEYPTGAWPAEETLQEEMALEDVIPEGEYPEEEYPEGEYPEEEYSEDEYPEEEYPEDEYPEEEYPEGEYPEEEYPEGEYPEEEYPEGEYPEEEYPEGEYPEEEYPEGENLDAEEMQEYFGNLLQMKGMEDRIRDCLAQVSMEPITGNVIITGSEKSARLKLAMGIVKTVQARDFEFVGKPAKVPAQVLNTKDVRKAMAAMNNAALIIENAGELTIETVDTIAKVINHSNVHILIILEDTSAEIKKLMSYKSYMKKLFNIRVDIPSYSNDDLVAHAKEYAKENEYSIDELGVLALYTRINNLQRSNHVVTIEEVEEIMNEAMDSANKKSFAHFKDVLFSRRYDPDDLIILREKDFTGK